MSSPDSGIEKIIKESFDKQKKNAGSLKPKELSGISAIRSILAKQQPSDVLVEQKEEPKPTPIEETAKVGTVSDNSEDIIKKFIAEKSLSAHKVSLEEMFWESQKKLKETKNEDLENLTEELSDALAEELLSDKKVDNNKIKELYEKYVSLM